MLDWIFKKKEVQEAVQVDETLRKDLVVLMILDGLGIIHDIRGNAVVQASTPFLDEAWTHGTSTLLHASGTHVGLPAEEVGNSEVGHLNIGAGQVVYQSLPRINEAIESGTFQEHPVLKEAFAKATEKKSKVHLMGILSAGGVHGHIEHLFELIDICKKEGHEPYIHAILDGRDTGMTDGYFYLSKLTEKLKEVGVGKIASIQGRFFAMDRDKRWERVQRAYNAFVGMGERTATDPFALVQKAYKDGENDQILIPTTMIDDKGEAVGPIKSDDIILFYNFREDRSKQITQVFTDPEFDSLDRHSFPENLHFVTMTGYSDSPKIHVIFPPKRIDESLSSVISKHRMNQLHMAETEKYMHVTYFFNGGEETPHPGEDFFNIPSPKVFDYAMTPQMSAAIIKDEVVYRLSNLDKKKYSFVVINFANPDMLGHTGDLEATKQAVEITDKIAREVSEKTLEVGGSVIMISDHGNCETMIDRVTKKVDTAHTNNPVPFILLTEQNQINGTRKGGKIFKIGTGERAQVTGILADVAPTTLGILGVEPPPSMTGINLLTVV